MKGLPPEYRYVWDMLLNNSYDNKIVALLSGVPRIFRNSFYDVKLDLQFCICCAMGPKHIKTSDNGCPRFKTSLLLRTVDSKNFETRNHYHAPRNVLTVLTKGLSIQMSVCSVHDALPLNQSSACSFYFHVVSS